MSQSKKRIHQSITGKQELYIPFQSSSVSSSQLKGKHFFTFNVPQSNLFTIISSKEMDELSPKNYKKFKDPLYLPPTSQSSFKIDLSSKVF